MPDPRPFQIALGCNQLSSQMSHSESVGWRDDGDDGIDRMIDERVHVPLMERAVPTLTWRGDRLVKA